MKTQITIFDDKREITTAYAAGDEGEFWKVGCSGVTKIVPYQEMGGVWLAIYVNDEVAIRVNCAALECIAYNAT